MFMVTEISRILRPANPMRRPCGVAWDAVPEPMVEYIDPGFFLFFFKGIKRIYCKMMSSSFVLPGSLKRRFIFQDIAREIDGDSPHLQVTKQINFGAITQDNVFQYNQSDLSFLLQEKSTRPEYGLPLEAPDTISSGFSFSEVVTSVSRPTKRAAACGQMNCYCVPPTVAKNNEQSCNSGHVEINESSDVHSKPSPSVKFDVAVVPQKEWDQLFEMALKVTSWRIVTNDFHHTSPSF
jgi:hypothetical protein